MLVIAGACGGKHPAPPVVISNVAPPPDAAAPDAADEAVCDEPAEAPLTIGGVTGKVALVRCSMGDSSTSELSREQGFIEHQRIARLSWTAAGKTVGSEIRAWTDGWEWGSGITLEGVLLAPNGDGVALIRFTSNVAAPDALSGSATTLTAYKLDAGDWQSTDLASAATLELTWSQDLQTVTIDGCDADPGSGAPGCGVEPQGKPIPTLAATFDGKQVTTHASPPSP